MRWIKLTPEIHHKIYLVGLAMMVIGLPVSKVLISISQMVLLGNWLLEGHLKTKLQQFWQNKGAVLIASIFLLHLLGLLYTTDFNYALNDLRTKLPLLILPLVMASTRKISWEQFQLISGLYIGAVLVATFVSTFIFLGLTGEHTSDIRDISIFVSHIRFGLLICIAIFGLVYFAFENGNNVQAQIVQIALAFWLMLFIVILESMTGIVILLATGYSLLLYLLLFKKVLRKRWMTFSTVGLLVLAPVLCASYLGQHVANFYDTETPDYATLDKQTPYGEVYRHHKKKKQLENGHYVWTFVAWKELEATWHKRSDLQFWGKDLKGQPMHATLIRFLASKGYRKDADGVNQLSREEVVAIENGTANVLFMGNKSIQTRIYQIIWEFDNYKNGGNPEGNSVAQRWEFWKTAWSIIQQNPVIGVGTGDVKLAFQEEYERSQSPLSEKYRLRAHNQYLTLAVAFGFVGFIWFLFAFLYPMIHLHKTGDYFYMIFFLIVSLSMFNEDTLETQVGISIFAFFSCFFLFGIAPKSKSS